MEQLIQDLRYGFRTFARQPAFAVTAVLALALGIGANTAIFSVVNALMLRSLPVLEPQRLVTVSSGFALSHGFRAGAGMNYDMWSRMSERIRMFDGGFAWAPARVDLSSGGAMQPADALFTSGGFFATLGVPALIGRTFTVADDVRGGGRDGLVAVIGYGLWQRRFGGATNAIGAVLPVEGIPCTVIGVMPPEFFGVEVGQPFDVALPLAIEPDVRGPRASLHHPSALMLTAMLRLRHDQSLDAATAALRPMQPEVLGVTAGNRAEQLPEFLKDPYVLVPAGTGTSDRSGLRRQYVRPLLTILAVVVLVLLVACVNIANLLLARSAARRHEMSVRVALGASRWRLARHLMVESLVLSAIGALAGLLFATWASRAVVASLSTVDRQVLLDLSLDWRVMTVTAAAAVATAVLFGTGPAVRAARAPAIDALKTHGPGAGTRTNLSSSLVVCQVALSLVLLFGAGLFLSTFNRLATQPLGFDRDRVLVVDVDTARAHSDDATRPAYYRQLIEALQSIPGVAHAAASAITPFSRATKSPLFNQPDRVHEHVVSPDYFAVYGIPIRAGRDFDARDTANGARVLVVSESYARKYLADRSPIGAIVDKGACARASGRCTVVGVVADAVFGAPRVGAHPTVYVPLAQSAGLLAPARREISFSVRPASGSAGALARAVAAALASVDRNLAFSYRPLEQDVTAAFTQERLVAGLSAFFGALGLLLSALGLYGVTSYAVNHRITEIGIRLALGATRGTIMRLLLRRVALLIGIGLVLGGAVSLWAARFVEVLLYGLEPADPRTFVGAALILCAVGLFASWLPALRASWLEPARVLRRS